MSGARALIRVSGCRKTGEKRSPEQLLPFSLGFPLPEIPKIAAISGICRTPEGCELQPNHSIWARHFPWDRPRSAINLAATCAGKIPHLWQCQLGDSGINEMVQN